ncbi:MAG: hypothetical protein OES79_02935 [Planctomycetota bacterium]|nr:hypothetical protein [Planctomycetota bacterium]
MAENPYDSPQTPDENIVVASGVYKDRSMGLLLFGCLQILMGSFCALMVPLMLISIPLAQQSGQPSPGTSMVPAVVFYIVFAIAGVSLGIGSIRCRRWARALTLVGSWMWLLTGLASMLFLVLFMPRMFGQMEELGEMPAGAELFVLLFMGGILGCFYVVLPATFVAFYQNSHVKATCEWKNPQPCWTDRCPLPVLAMSLALGLMGMSMILMLPSAMVFPIFGTFLSGIPAAIIILVLGVVLVALAYGSYQLQMAAWRGTLIVITLWALSTIVTFTRGGLMGMYEQMNMPEEQLEIIRRWGFANSAVSATSTAVGALFVLGYILYVRKYFVAAGNRESGDS